MAAITFSNNYQQFHGGNFCVVTVMDGRVGFLSRLRVNSTVNSCCKLLRCPNVKLHGISLGLRVLSLSQWTPQVAFWTFNTWSSENLHKAIVTSIFGIHSCSPDISTAILLTSYIFNTSSYSTANVPASIKIYYQCCSYSLTSLICFPQRSALFGRIKTGTSRTWAWICPRGSGINSYIGINIRATSNLRNCGRHPTLHLILHQAGEKCLMAYHSPTVLSMIRLRTLNAYKAPRIQARWNLFFHLPVQLPRLCLPDMFPEEQIKSRGLPGTGLWSHWGCCKICWLA